MAWMIYGAYGYTGRLITAEACRRGERPLLAGRDARRLRALGSEFGLDHRVFALSDPAALGRGLEGVTVVAHCAGPFSATSKAMVDACLAAGTHYLDITGEIDVFESILPRDGEARDAGVVLLPGAGFDVVPSDCLAALLAAAMPGGALLELAFRTDGGPSPGTARTAMEALGAIGRARVGGVITAVPAQRRRRSVDFADGRATVSAISWGDVSTAYYSTGIEDIVVYAALPGAAGPIAALAAAAGSVVASRGVQRLLKRAVGMLRGPSAAARATTTAQLWGRVTDAGGHFVTGTMTTPNPYDLTADAVVSIVGRIAAGAVAAGAHTPSGALGAGFAGDLAGVKVDLA
jgi:short subunit dehydrogenase-like uncharacterized protein